LVNLYGSNIRILITAHYALFTFSVTACRPSHYWCRSGHLGICIARIVYPLDPLFVALLIIPMGIILLIKYLVPFPIISAGTVVFFYFIFIDDGGRDPQLRRTFQICDMADHSLVAVCRKCSISMDDVGMVSIIFLHFFYRVSPHICVILSRSVYYLLT